MVLAHIHVLYVSWRMNSGQRSTWISTKRGGNIRQGLPERCEATGRTACLLSSVKLHISPTVCNLLLMLLFALAPGTGRDSNNYTQPHLSPNHRTHTHTHINYLLLFTCGQVCVYVCVFMAYAELKLTALLWGYIQSFSSIFHISVQFYLHSTN